MENHFLRAHYTRAGIDEAMGTTASAERETPGAIIQQDIEHNTGMPYRAPAWLPGGHAQTIYPTLFARRPHVNFRREKWPTPDGDFIEIDFVDGTSGKPFLVLFHGMEGSSNSHYAREIMAHIHAMGWSGAIPHFRSCSGQLNTAPRLYHCGDYEEADWILRRMHDISVDGADENARGTRPFFVAGVSLGGSVLLQWLGQSQNAANFVDAAVAVCAPLDVAAGGHAISRGFNRIYTRTFLRTLIPKALKKLEQHPGLYDRDAVLRCKTIYDFDRIVTAPLHGFQSVDHYWECASVNRLLPDITVPTLVLNTQNDPFLPARCLPTHAADSVELEYHPHGGHLGFTTGPPPGRHTWLAHRLTSFLSRFNP